MKILYFSTGAGLYRQYCVSGEHRNAPAGAARPSYASVRILNGIRRPPAPLAGTYLSRYGISYIDHFPEFLATAVFGVWEEDGRIEYEGEIRYP